MFRSLFPLLALHSLSPWAWGKPTELVLLHTNDLHSHFRPDRTPLRLGGLGRLATAVRQLRSEEPNTLFFDGGDWSEGSIYYTEGTGREALELMDRVGYDAIVVGNHDWLNGPDVLLDSIEAAKPSFSILASNVSLSNHARAQEFQQKIPPYAIREIGGLRVGMIGLLTFEWIYDRYLQPVKITDPFRAVRDLARTLKPQVDLIVAISHNGLGLNELLLKELPDLDLIIGAHDHVLLHQPMKVQRRGAAPGWIVEAGKWGQYLGALRIRVTPRAEVKKADQAPRVSLVNYRLIQMDSRFPEDPKVLAEVDALEALIERRMGPVFHDHVCDNELELDHHGMEAPVGNLVTDAFLAHSGADLALDAKKLINGELHAGVIRSVDVFNTLPAIFNKETGKTWTLGVLPMSGRNLLWILNVLYSNGKITRFGTLNTSGLEVVFNSSLYRESTSLVAWELYDGQGEMHPLSLFAPVAQTPGYIRSVTIQGKPLDPARDYRVAISGGMIESIQFLNGLLPNAIPMQNLVDTGKETWRILKDYLHSLGRVTREKLALSGRIRSVQPDLHVASHDIEWEGQTVKGNKVRAKVSVRVTNYGANPSKGEVSRIRLLQNRNGVDYSTPPEYIEVGTTKQLPSLGPNEETIVVWDFVELSADQGLFPVTAEIQYGDDELNQSDNEATRLFAPESQSGI